MNAAATAVQTPLLRRHNYDLTWYSRCHISYEKMSSRGRAWGGLFPYICPGKVNQSETETGESQGYSDSVKKLNSC
jgi:hypothetical protein